MLGGAEPMLQVFMCLRRVVIRRPANPYDSLGRKNWLEWGDEVDANVAQRASTVKDKSRSADQSSEPTSSATDIASSDTRSTTYAARMYMCLPLPIKKSRIEGGLSPVSEDSGRRRNVSDNHEALPGAHHQLIVDISCGALSARVDDDFLKRLRELAHSVNSFRAERRLGETMATDTGESTDTSETVSYTHLTLPTICSV